jgi:hypothetical protein
MTFGFDLERVEFSRGHFDGFEADDGIFMYPFLRPEGLVGMLLGVANFPRLAGAQRKRKGSIDDCLLPIEDVTRETVVSSRV